MKKEKIDEMSFIHRKREIKLNFLDENKNEISLQKFLAMNTCLIWLSGAVIWTLNNERISENLVVRMSSNWTVSRYELFQFSPKFICNIENNHLKRLMQSTIETSFLEEFISRRLRTYIFEELRIEIVHQISSCEEINALQIGNVLKYFVFI